MSCNICCEKYNKSTNSKVICPSCDYDACKLCIRTYLKSSVKAPHCANCNLLWNNDFLINNLNRSFVDGEYKKSRSIILLNAELSKIPEYMEHVEKLRESSNYEKIEEDIKNEIAIKKAELDKLNSKLRECKNNIFDIKSYKFDIKKEDKEENKFVMPCKVDKCKGFLSKHYKCGLCSTYTCSKCFEIKKDDLHECKEEDVLTAQELKKNTKACPKCGIRIIRSQGCSQMYCIECKTVFDWITGKIQIGGVIHNPHYYEMLKGAGRTINPNNEILCNNLIPLHYIDDLFYTIKWFPTNNTTDKQLSNIKNENIQKFNINFKEALKNNSLISDKTKYNNIRFDQILKNFHRFVAHVEYELGRINRNDDVHINKRCTIEYLLDKITEKDLQQKLMIIDKNKNIKREKFEIYELVYITSLEIINNIYNEMVNQINIVKLSINELHNYLYNLVYDGLMRLIEIINYANKQLAKVAFNYNVKANFIYDYSYILINGNVFLNYLSLSINKDLLESIKYNDNFDYTKVCYDAYYKQIEKQKQIKNSNKGSSSNEGSSSNGINYKDLSETESDNDDD